MHVGPNTLFSAAGITTDITSNTGIELIDPAPDVSGFVRCRWSRRRFLPVRRDHRYRTKPEKPSAGPISAIPVVEVISVVIPAAE